MPDLDLAGLAPAQVRRNGDGIRKQKAAPVPDPRGLRVAWSRRYFARLYSMNMAFISCPPIVCHIVNWTVSLST